MSRTLIALALSVGMIASAHADLKPVQTKAETKFNKEIKTSVAQVEAKCGAKVAVHADFSKFQEADWKGKSVSAYCANILSALRTVCEDAAYKPAVAKSIQNVACELDGKAGKADEAITVSGGTVTYAMNKSHSNVSKAAVDAVKKALDAQ